MGNIKSKIERRGEGLREMSLLKSQKRRGGGARIKDIKVATQNEIVAARATVVQREAWMMLPMLTGPCVPSLPAGWAHLSDRRNRKNTKK